MILVSATKVVDVADAIVASTGCEPMTLSVVDINPLGYVLGFLELRNPHVTYAGCAIAARSQMPIILRTPRDLETGP